MYLSESDDRLLASVVETQLESVIDLLESSGAKEEPKLRDLSSKKLMPNLLSENDGVVSLRD